MTPGKLGSTIVQLVPLVVTIAALNTIKIIPQGDVAIVERLGKFNRRLEPGLHICIPVLESVRKRLTTREQVFDIPPQKCITSDNAPLSADAVVYWRIVDPEKAVYAVVDLKDAIQNLVLTQLRSEVGKLTLDMTFSAREQMNAVLLRDLNVTQWGIEIMRVEVRDIIPNQELLRAMEKQMAAERSKRAVIIESQGKRESAVNQAEGEAQSRLIAAKAQAEALALQAEAEAKKLELEASGVAKALDILGKALDSPVAAAEFQLMREKLAMQRDLSTSPNAKVILGGGGNGIEDLFARASALLNSE